MRDQLLEDLRNALKPFAQHASRLDSGGRPLIRTPGDGDNDVPGPDDFRNALRAYLAATVAVIMSEPPDDSLVFVLSPAQRDDHV